jgi:hypothetical protein
MERHLSNSVSYLTPHGRAGELVSPYLRSSTWKVASIGSTRPIANCRWPWSSSLTLILAKVRVVHGEVGKALGELFTSR